MNSEHHIKTATSPDKRAPSALDIENAQKALFDAGLSSQVSRVATAFEKLGRTSEAVGFISETLFANASRIIDRSFAASKPACGAGCSHCCQIPVLITPLEALALARHVDANFSEAMRDSLVERLMERVERLSGATREELENHRSPCALLSSEGHCTAYGARPIACRATSSFSAQDCREASLRPLESLEIESDANALLWGAAIVEGLRRGLSTVQLDSSFYELNSVLLFMLSHSDAEGLWLQGNALSELSPTVRHPF